MCCNARDNRSIEVYQPKSFMQTHTVLTIKSCIENTDEKESMCIENKYILIVKHIPFLQKIIYLYDLLMSSRTSMIHEYCDDLSKSSFPLHEKQITNAYKIMSFLCRNICFLRKSRVSEKDH